MSFPAGIALRYRASLRTCDLVIRATGNGRGRIGLDTSPATALLAALGSDRRAETSDTLPQTVALLPAQGAGVFSRRGWTGDILLPDETRLGSRLWLLERGRCDESDRVAAIGYASEAVAPLSAWTGEAATVTASWLRRGVLRISVTLSGATVNAVAGSV